MPVSTLPRRWTPLRTGLALLAATGVLVVLADLLFWQAPLGWTAALYAAALLAVLLLRRPATLRSRAAAIALAGIAGLLVALVLEPTPLALACVATLLLSLPLVAHRWHIRSAAQWLQQVLAQLGLGVIAPLRDTAIARRWSRRHPTAGQRPRGLRLWVVPLLLGGVFVGLFSLANPLVLRWVMDAWLRLLDVLERIPLLLDAMRIAFWLVAAAAVWMLLRARPVRLRGLSPLRPPALPQQRPPAGAAPVVLRCLIVFNAVFAVQNALDLRYLVAGSALPDGMTYAEYAHRGAYPLVAAALLAGLFVITTFGPGSVSERSPLSRRLVYFWLGQTLILTLAAVYRLDLYVGVYTLSRLRLAAGIWMALVALGLVWIALRISLRRSNTWLVNANALTAAVVLYACCFADFDGVIARYNVTHAREMGGSAGVPIDLPYLQELGPEALPAVRLLSTRAAMPATRESAAQVQQALDEVLDEQLADWRGWTIRRSRLRTPQLTASARSYSSP